MPATGLHGILHYLIAKFSKKSEKIKATVSNDFFYGFIVGGFLPDYDPFTSLIIWLILGDLSTEKLAKIHETFHRTATHSIFFVVALIIIGLILGLHRSKGKSITLGISAGVMLHILLDLPYMVGVAIFWPLIPRKFGLFWSLPPIINRVRQALFKLWYAVFFTMIYYAAKTEKDRRIKISTPIFAVLFVATVTMVTKPGIFDIIHAITELISLVMVAYLLLAEKTTLCKTLE